MKDTRKPIGGDSLYFYEQLKQMEKLSESDESNKLTNEQKKHLNGYMFDSLVYRYQLARQELAKYIACYNSNRPLEQENRNANRDIMRFVQILDELVGEGNRD